MPYASLSAVSAVAVLMFKDVGTANGFYIFAITNAALYAILLLVIVVNHIRENGITVRRRSMPAFAHALLAAFLLIPVSAGAAIRGPYGVEAIAMGAGPLSLTEVRYRIAGAAQGGTGARVVTWRLTWGEAGGNDSGGRRSKALEVATDAAYDD
jgi:hypothetical protein